IDGQPGIDGRAVERFIGVEIADAGDDILGEKQGLDPAAPFVQQFAELAKRKPGIEWIGTERMFADVVVWRLRDVDHAEEPHILEGQTAAAVEFEDDARKSWRFAA